MQQVEKSKVLVAPLNWGLGHASRCILVIKFLIANNYVPVIASDGEALAFLKKEFPKLRTVELPSYNIQYSKIGFLLKWKLLSSFFSIRKAVKQEQNIVSKLVKSEKFVGIISDNRFGVYHKGVPSIYITHQLQVLSGVTTFFSTFFHQRIISKYHSCWVPDYEGDLNLSGALSNRKNNKIPVSYIGNLSRFKFLKNTIKYDILVLLSGPEPQRSLLENKMLKELKNFKGKILLVRGSLDCVQNKNNSFDSVDYLLSEDLEEVISASKFVIARSGYSTIMDLAKMNKKVFFIPTPGQTEQIYLAKNLQNKNIAPYCSQEVFNVQSLEKLKDYSGFTEGYPFELKKELLDVFIK